jgi:predicted transcriptional regulator of viral defense system
MDATRELSHARRFLGQLMKRGYVERVKKGLYVWGQDIDPTPYSTELLANLIYGPSYVSLEYALSFHGLIPERVATVTSVTFKKNKTFNTPVGVFTYDHINLEAYAAGIRLQIEAQHSFLIATPEKALLDVIALRDVGDSLLEDLRIEPEEFARLNVEALKTLGASYKSRAVKTFIKGLARG